MSALVRLPVQKKLRNLRLVTVEQLVLTKEFVQICAVFLERLSALEFSRTILVELHQRTLVVKPIINPTPATKIITPLSSHLAGLGRAARALSVLFVLLHARLDVRTRKTSHSHRRLDEALDLELIFVKQVTARNAHLAALAVCFTPCSLATT